ncbi:RNA polymerase factor sigma-54 [Marivivens sp. LCG002]|uniref:RNA polymerase factor sigma-54 n=1 Tax=Marivivens sp. LCG002 TaxID=3051171 RepID=UPI0025535F5C|nr:RNA polymerase factor sigma-54 [Marivivens sp. LCG002]WIV51276.1 RNA polymerase factor sigma-54 [Marivivens sp. LCG002]
MQISTSQFLSQRQSLVVTAQLQQAINLLQLGNHELANFIEEQAAENPFLEVGLPKQSMSPTLSYGGTSRSKGADWDVIGSLAEDHGPSLYAHATAEINRLGLSAVERRRAEAFLDALEPSGWLGQPLEVIAIAGAMSKEESEDLLAKLHRVEPAGLFARNLAECLRLQAADLEILTPLFASVLDNLALLASADLKGLAKACDATLDDIKPVLRQIRALNPKPGAIFEGEISPQRPPDLIVTRGAEGWNVDLNRSTLPTVVVSKASALDRRHEATEQEKTFIEDRVSVARWLQRAVEHRNMTTLKVGAEVVKRQQAFLEFGSTHLRPMILREVADAIGVHESTVSRVTAGLMIQTPQGTLPLKLFFNAALGAKDGNENGSAAAVRHRIKQLIGAEDPKKPLSDDTLVKIISEEGTEIARRTVAKYREMLGIPSSVNRRRQHVVSGAI